jgi:putative toxin-antitoxin system antitoxin component (TIGR02293 family)
MAGTEQAISQHAIDVINQAIRAWESREQALEWLQRPIPALDDERPCDLLGSEEGCRRIALVLRKIEQGDFS